MSSALMSFSILLTNPVPVDAVRSALEGREELWFICLLVASGGVAIGCMLEIPETWADLKEWRKLRKESADDPPSWRVPMATIGLLLVVLGVIGEGVFEALVSINETALRAHDEQSLAATIKEAGAAKDSADAAATAAGLASKAAGDALGKADAAEITADKAGRSASGALVNAGEAKAEVATVQSNIAKVDEKYAPRTLSKTRRGILVDLLTKTFQKPQKPIGVGWDVSAPDGGEYAKEIAEAINDPATGWKAKEESAMIGDDDKVGVFLVVRDGKSVPRWMVDLHQDLAAAGITNEVAKDARLPEDEARILICKKN